MNWNSQNSVSSSKPGNKLFPLIAQLVKNLPAMQETPVRVLGWEDALEKGYPLWYSWASLVAQLVKNPPTMRETWLGKIPVEGKGYPLQYSGLEKSMDCTVPGVAKSWTWLSNFHFHFIWGCEVAFSCQDSLRMTGRRAENLPSLTRYLASKGLDPYNSHQSNDQEWPQWHEAIT